MRKIAVAEFVPSFLAENMIKKGWELGGDVGLKPLLVSRDVPNLKLFSPLFRGEREIDCYVLQERAKILKANFGLSHADVLLRNKEIIPVEFQDWFLALPGTTMYDWRYVAQMPCMIFDQTQGWVVEFKRRDSYVNDNFRLLRLP